MKKTISIVMTLLLAFVSMTGCSAAEDASRITEDFVLTMQIGNPVMTVNGAEKPIDAEGSTPVIVNDRTLLPVRAVVEEMGGTVAWDGTTQTVTLTYHSDEIKLVIDNLTATANGAPQTLDTAPTIIHDRTMLPIRFIAESFQFKVDWAQETQTVTITKPSEAASPAEQPVTQPATEPTTQPTSGGKTLVVYYSASGNTERVANHVAAAANADVFKLEPAKPYTSADLNYNNNNSRVVYEHEHPEAQDIELVSTTVPNWDSYDTVFIGYPIWWHSASWVVYNFVKDNDFTGKTVIPFSTSASSGEVGSEVMQEMTTTGDWQEGNGFRSSASESDVAGWVETILPTAGDSLK